ncbi:Remodeling and spacing factor 1/sw-like protein, partial [Daphnia magna]
QSFSHNQELPKFGGSSPTVGLDPVQLKSPTAVESAPISDDPVSSDHFSPSTSEIVTPNLVSSAELPACSTLVQKDSSEIEESHPEQIIELKTEPLENINSNVIINANTTEAESQLTIQTLRESPAQSGINYEKVIPVVDRSTPCDENIIWKVDQTYKSSDVPNVLKDSNIEESGPLDIGEASAIQSAESFLLGSVPLSEKTPTVAVVDCTKDSDPPSVFCSLQEKPQCSESDPIIEDANPLMLKEENNCLSPGNESEETKEAQAVISSLSDVPVPQTERFN